MSKTLVAIGLDHNSAQYKPLSMVTKTLNRVQNGMRHLGIVTVSTAPAKSAAKAKPHLQNTFLALDAV